LCDTFIALGKSTLDGRTYFGKNSDREVNEPQYVFFYPRRTSDSEEQYTTSQKVKSCSKTFALLISKPSWMWGGEMGVNEKGVVIGNEAVFTKELVNRYGILGMDILRLALERSENSEQAIEIIAELIQNYGQGGNGGYTSNLFYHNSFIIADRERAWVLESSDRYWVASEVRDFTSISNCLTLTDRIDKQHPETVKNALEKGWCKSEEKFQFAASYEKKLYKWLSGSSTRQSRTLRLLSNAPVDLSRSFEILRDHEFERIPGSMKNICMHAGRGLISSQTTGSMVVVLGDNIEVWTTNSSAPCLSIYKPVWLARNSSTLPFEKESDGLNYWGNWEKFHRLGATRPVKARQLWEEYCLVFEEELIKHSGEANRKELSSQAFEKSWKIARKMTSVLQESPEEASYFEKRYWKRKEVKLQELRERNFRKTLPT
jgi:hypothetical protein